MSRLDDLPPDQHAALSLLLRQQQTYSEVAALLGIDERAVADRAHAALAVLAPSQARALSAERRESIGDYLLGQQRGVAERLRTRTFLMGSEPAREWATAISAELSPLAAGSLPEVPVAAPATVAEHAAEAASSQETDGGQRSQAGPAAAPAPGPDAAPAGVTRTGPSMPSSRRAGAVLLVVMVAVVIVAVILLGKGSGHGTTTKGAKDGSASSTSAGSAASASKATEDKRITLTSPNPTSKAVGVAEVLSEASKYAFYLAAEHLPPSRGFFYAVWLYNSPTSHEALSRSPPVGSDGRLQGGALLPQNAGEFHTMLLTKETSNRPTHPGPVVLSGAFALH